MKTTAVKDVWRHFVWHSRGGQSICIDVKKTVMSMEPFSINELGGLITVVAGAIAIVLLLCKNHHAQIFVVVASRVVETPH